MKGMTIGDWIAFASCIIPIVLAFGKAWINLLQRSEIHAAAINSMALRIAQLEQKVFPQSMPDSTRLVKQRKEEET
jgi:hypothetical protein